MLLTRNQLLIIIAVLIVSCGAWGLAMKLLIDSSLELKWSLIVWFLGGCSVAALVIAAIDIPGLFERKRKDEPLRRIQDKKIKIDGDINPLLIAMRHKITEVKTAAKKGVDHE